jgi:hypothetical protein
MHRQLILAFAVLFLVPGCGGMNIEDFKGSKPEFRPEAYFAGKSEAWGIFEDRFGKLRAQFKVDIDGQWDPTSRTLVLTEDFLYSDGKTERRVWTLRKRGDNDFTGSAADVVGEAVAQVQGNAMNLRYDFNMKIGDMTVRVHFDDWMFLMDEQVMINRATVTKFGLEIGSATIFFRKADKAAAVAPEMETARAA